MVGRGLVNLERVSKGKLVCMCVCWSLGLDLVVYKVGGCVCVFRVGGVYRLRFIVEARG